MFNRWMGRRFPPRLRNASFYFFPFETAGEHKPACGNTTILFVDVGVCEKNTHNAQVILTFSSFASNDQI